MSPDPSTFFRSNGHRIVGLIAMVIGSLICFFLVYQPWRLATAAERWKEVPCAIVSSRMIEVSNSDGPDSYVPDIRYAYRIDGKMYESSRVFLVSWGRNEASVQRFVGRYPVGSSASAFVNPDDPTESVLDRHFRLSWIFPLLSLCLLVFGSVLLFFKE
jgi:hypothetical protein